MGLLDRFTGTLHPDGSAAPLSAAEVREALLAVNGPDKPYVVRNARPAEKADLVAEWRVLEPAWRSFFLQTRLDRTLKTKMRLVPGKHEVRALDEQLEITWIGDTPKLAKSAEYGRGQVTTVSKQWTFERGPDGRRRIVEEFSFDTRQMKTPLQKAVLGAGWTWRGALFKL
ncbi:hypothetical protein ACIA6C_01045 [Streptomyces sp. NPDC051578]|uniref:hypothetical protein n=1 Tax=Streptomyces sp. NPDC051578 TaxID=3365662 RepID=UPI00379BFE67